MRGRSRSIRLAAQSNILGVAGLLALLPALGQRSASPVTDTSSVETSLLDLSAAEGRTGTYVFYTQSFVDSENRKASYTGSVYGAIKSIRINDCLVNVDAEIVDLFNGTVAGAPIAQQQDSSTYSYSFVLTRELVQSSEVIQARPIQLRRTTRSSCSDNSSCDFTWLRIKSTKPVFKETILTNGMREFQGTAHQLMIPLSSAEAGERLVANLRSLAAARCP